MDAEESSDVSLRPAASSLYKRGCALPLCKCQFLCSIAALADAGSLLLACTFRACALGLASLRQAIQWVRFKLPRSVLLVSHLSQRWHKC
jgi:hypothetical protein